jgi:hypothetical protein
MIVANPHDWWYQEIMNNSTSPFYELRKATQHNPILVARNIIGHNEKEGKYLIFV